MEQVFDQFVLICEWWYKVYCTNSPKLYQENTEHITEKTYPEEKLQEGCL